MIVVPAIIPKSREQMEVEIKKVSHFAKLVQIDISDGIFTPVKTWPYNGEDVDYFEKLKTEDEGWPEWDSIDYEVHLMLKSPESVLSDWVHTGVETIIIHIEATDNFQNVIDICKSSEVSIGLALKPSTEIEIIKPFVDQIDFIQVMGSDNLGHHGVKLEEIAIQKIEELQNLYPGKIIAVDIGVSEETEDRLVSAGVDKLVSGSFILDSDNPEEAYNSLSR